MKLNEENVFIYESDGLGITLPRNIYDYIKQLEAVVEAAREVDLTTGAGLAKLKEALEALDKLEE